MRCSIIVLSILAIAPLAACGDDDNNGGTEADRHGIGAICSANEDCFEQGQTCLPFKGGYCGVADCTGDEMCPSGARCVAHTDGKNYCFRVCTDKTQCNFNRPLEFESNCSSNITFVSGGKSTKACVPPS